MKAYILTKDCPNIGKEIGDYYGGEFGEDIEKLIQTGIIEPDLTPEQYSLRALSVRISHLENGIDKLLSDVKEYQKLGHGLTSRFIVSTLEDIKNPF